jgi:hypothetical protein
MNFISYFKTINYPLTSCDILGFRRGGGSGGVSTFSVFILSLRFEFCFLGRPCFFSTFLFFLSQFTAKFSLTFHRTNTKKISEIDIKFTKFR